MRRRSAALGAAHGSSTVKLRRTVFGRLFGTTTAAVLTVFAVLDLALLVLAVLGPLFGKSTNGRWWLISPVVFVLLWARVITAWTQFDDAGVHTRYWVRFDYPWSDMRSVTLQRLGCGPARARRARRRSSCG